MAHLILGPMRLDHPSRHGVVGGNGRSQEKAVSGSAEELLTTPCAARGVGTGHWHATPVLNAAEGRWHGHLVAKLLRPSLYKARHGRFTIGGPSVPFNRGYPLTTSAFFRAIHCGLPEGGTHSSEAQPLCGGNEHVEGRLDESTSRILKSPVLSTPRTRTRIYRIYLTLVASCLLSPP